MGIDDDGVAPILERTAPNGVNITNVSFTPDSVKRAIKKMNKKAQHRSWHMAK